MRRNVPRPPIKSDLPGDGRDGTVLKAVGEQTQKAKDDALDQSQGCRASGSERQIVERMAHADS
jgi:hypothetical protein